MRPWSILAMLGIAFCLFLATAPTGMAGAAEAGHATMHGAHAHSRAAKAREASAVAAVPSAPHCSQAPASSPRCDRCQMTGCPMHTPLLTIFVEQPAFSRLGLAAPLPARLDLRHRADTPFRPPRIA